MATAAASKSLLLSQLRQAERHVASLDRLTVQIRKAISQVDLAVGGSATRQDKAIVDKLQFNLRQLEATVKTMRAALSKGYEFADTLF